MLGKSVTEPRINRVLRIRALQPFRHEPARLFRCRPQADALIWAAVLWLLLGTQASLSSPLNVKAENAARAAAFEVVVSKPEHDPVTYEKPLPLHLLPYSVRSDSHLSIGTAFCIGRNQFVSAAHVLGMSVGSQYGPPALRDQQGRIYEIDQILKYSAHEDFVVFSLAQPADVKPLAVNLDRSVNTPVHAMGNALGEGIVIRDGLFTSETPEQQDGRWKWIRFSAAASPGTSGGPLLDARGRVIGVVLAASPSENLNYALPIERVLSAPERRARIDTRGSYRLPVMSESITTSLKQELPLPKTWAEFSRELLDLINRHADAARAELLKTHSGSFFPQGEQAVELLHSLYFAATPRLIMKSGDERWEAKTLWNETTVALPKNGSITSGAAAGAQLARLIKPDEVTVSDLFSDSKLYMDLMLKSVKLSRTVDSESIKITSLGRSGEESEYLDTYKRKWQLRTWAIPFSDSVLVSLALPLPNGCVALMRMVPSGQAHPNIEELRILADLIYVTYTGSLSEWREFLALKPWHPQAFSRLDIAFEYDKFFRYRSPRLELSVTSYLQNITAKSQLVLKFSYFLDDGSPTWDVAGLHLTEKADFRVYVDVARRPRPAQSLAESFQEDWQRMIKRESPHHSRAYFNEGLTVIGTTVTASTGPTKPIDPSSKLVYEVNYVVPGSLDDGEMRSLQKTVLEGLKILEE